MLWPQLTEHALLPPQTGVSAVVSQVVVITCLMLLSSKQGLKMHSYMIPWRSQQLITTAREDLFLCFFFLFFSLPLLICVELEKLSRWNIVKCKGLLHTSVALKSQAPSILEKQPFRSCCLLGKLSLLRLSRLFLHILEFFVGFPQHDFREETCEQRRCGFRHRHLVDYKVTGFSCTCILQQRTSALLFAKCWTQEYFISLSEKRNRHFRRSVTDGHKVYLNFPDQDPLGIRFAPRVQVFWVWSIS